MDEAARAKIRGALREAILSLCNSAVDFQLELSVEGLLGITVDRRDVFLVNVNEISRSDEYEDQLDEPVSPTTSASEQSETKTKRQGGMSKRSYMKQLVKRRSAARKAATLAKVKTWKMTEKLKEYEKADMLKNCELVTPAMLKCAPPKMPFTESSLDENSSEVEVLDETESNSGNGKVEKALSMDWIPPEHTEQPQKSLGLPLPDPMTSPDKSDMIRIMNEVVGYNFMKKKAKQRKRGEYNNYSSEVRLRIGQHAVEHGIPATLQHFKKEFGRPISDSTVRSLRRAYVSAVDKNKEDPDNIKELPKKDRGRPLKLREYDQEVLDYIYNIRRNGGAVTVQIVMDAARGVLLHKAKHRLKEFGGKIEITKGWADSFIRRMKQAGYLPESGKTSHWDEKPQSSENIDELHALNAGENTGAHRVVVETPYSNVQPFLPISPNGNVTRDSYGQANIVQYQPGSFLQTTRVHRSIQLQNTALAREKQMCSLLQEAEPGLLLATPADFQVLNTNAPQANTTANPNASQQLTSPLEPSSGLDEQQNHAQAQGTVRFIQSQLASRYNFSHDQLGDGNYLNSTFAQLRPSADQEGGLFTPHSSLEQLSEAAGYVGALLHSGRNEIDALHNQSNDHQNQQQLAPASSSIINLGEQQQQQQQQLNFTDEHRSPPQL